MIILSEFSQIFRCYGLTLEKTEKPRQISENTILQEITRFVVERDEDGIIAALIKAGRIILADPVMCLMGHEKEALVKAAA